ncbi:hypothetical protein Lalb_Chr03g0040941 [Lupinus albus]|uniref:Uncharacterized protein n=1 Tax=Lupinus albus TaxID=3870 RepID=A0A6A4QXI2_LUPAL|nr:hypothetical protein Lalb_Chr03g0040941 [Lupinus albus]
MHQISQAFLLCFKQTTLPPLSSIPTLPHMALCFHFLASLLFQQSHMLTSLYFHQLHCPTLHSSLSRLRPLALKNFH